MDNFRTIEFNKRNFKSFGFYLKKDVPLYTFPELNYEEATIAGAVNGVDLLGSFSEENIERTYTFKTIPSKIPYSEDKFLKVFLDFVNTSRKGYKKLKDSAKPGYYCSAFLKSVGEIKKEFPGCYEISLTFSCRPYWYKENAEEVTQLFISPNEQKWIPLNNPERFSAFPYVKIERIYEGSETNNGVMIYDGDTWFEVLSIDGYIELDCEKKNAYKGSTPQNQRTNILTYPEYPKLIAGNNTWFFNFKKSNGAYRVTIKPRWRTL